jgi:hypothetical protein
MLGKFTGLLLFITLFGSVLCTMSAEDVNKGRKRVLVFLAHIIPVWVALALFLI